RASGRLVRAALLDLRAILAVSLGLEPGQGNEAQRRRVDAVTQPIGARPVGEDVTQVRIGAGRADLDPAHAVGGVDVLGDVLGLDRLDEAGPPGARIEL